MSRHLQVLPVLRSANNNTAAAKLRRPAAGKENKADTNRKRNRKSDCKGIGESDENYLNLSIDAKATDFDIQSCETPKSDKNRIPRSVACPPAPKKPLRRIGSVSCKRKLMPELDFFETDRRKEVDEFFRSSFERISAKRKYTASSTAAAAVGTTTEVPAAITSAVVIAVAAEPASSSSSSSPV